MPMPFKPVYHSQQDPQWRNDLLGFGEPGDTIGYIGCALTSVAMLLSGHGYAETPRSLNQKLKNVNGFVSAAIRWGSVSQLLPAVMLKSNISCATSDAPLGLIDAAIGAGQPAIVQVDRSPAQGIQTHWVVLYGRKGEDYLMLDPWPYQPDPTREDLLMRRYAQGNTLKRAISHVILYEAQPSGGPISPPTPGARARVRADVTWGLNIRSSIDTSSMANVLATVRAGTELLLLELDGMAKVGAINQWVRVRAPQGQEGFTAAWYLEKVSAAAPASDPVEAPVTPPANTPQPTEPASTPSPAPEPPKEERLVVVVSGAVGTSGLRMRKVPSLGGSLVTTLKTGTKLTVLESAGRAAARVGKANQWLHVREPNGKRGYVSAQFVERP